MENLKIKPLIVNNHHVTFLDGYVPQLSVVFFHS